MPLPDSALEMLTVWMTKYIRRKKHFAAVSTRDLHRGIRGYVQGSPSLQLFSGIRLRQPRFCISKPIFADVCKVAKAAVAMSDDAETGHHTRRLGPVRSVLALAQPRYLLFTGLRSTR